MSLKGFIRRLAFTETPGDVLDDTPLELPAGTRRERSASQEIQEQIAIQIAMKEAASGEPLQTVEQIAAELNDLDEDEDDPFFTPFEYIAMVDDIGPGDLINPTGDHAPTETEGDTDGQSTGTAGQSDSAAEETAAS